MDQLLSNISERTSLERTLKETGALVIDGSMSTALEAMGAKLNDRLWTARVLADAPELVKEVHLSYFRAGADCGITCSYQASIPGLLENGFTREEAEELITRSVRIFLEARSEWWAREGTAAGRAWPLCLAGIGPYGAYLADGSEYRGHYGLQDEELREFHYRRMELLWSAGADILLIETQPSLREAEIEAAIAEELGADYWISFSCMDGRHICEGDPIRECAKAFSEGYPHLRMIGVNCTAPEYITDLIRELRKGTDLPIGVYPNSGDSYDPVSKTWKHREGGRDLGEYALEYLREGALAVGGCCTTVQEHIRRVTAARDSFCGGAFRRMHP